RKPSVDIDPEKCVLCGTCEVMCPKNAITLTINGERENPVIVHEVIPDLIQSTTFSGTSFDWNRKEFVIDNCPTTVISYDEENGTLTVDDEHCIRCRQCEIASNGAFHVVQPWQGKVELRRDKCVEGCFACADICPTRALHINNEGTLVLADYFCIKCGACVQVCPIKAECEEYEVAADVNGVTKTQAHTQITNVDDLPVVVERWRVSHRPISSAAWTTVLAKAADDKAEEAEIDSKRALKRRDLLKALVGHRQFEQVED
ncbi:MAG: 4Fe-4S binding protein, partial [Anaerolineae bacterium]|nr:4Fe-4S binding protein [Anaerolineae bacterium]